MGCALAKQFLESVTGTSPGKAHHGTFGWQDPYSYAIQESEGNQIHVYSQKVVQNPEEVSRAPWQGEVVSSYTENS